MLGPLAGVSGSHSADFAAKLSELSAKQKPNLEKYMKEVREECTREAKKGHYQATTIILDCLCSAQEMRGAAESLGLTVYKAERLFSGKGVILNLGWAASVAPNVEDSEAAATQSRPLKRRRTEADSISGPSASSSSSRSTSSSSTSDPTFAARVSAISAACTPDMNKYMQEVKDCCLQEAGKGHKSANVVILDCLSSVSEIAEEVEMLGLTATRASRNHNHIHVTVEWPDSSDGVRLGQPSGLEKGNIKKTCCICFEQETMCRFHPCGHVIGKDCAQKVLDEGSACPVCRTTVRFVHAIFDP